MPITITVPPGIAWQCKVGGTIRCGDPKGPGAGWARIVAIDGNQITVEPDLSTRTERRKRLAAMRGIARIKVTELGQG